MHTETNTLKKTIKYFITVTNHQCINAIIISPFNVQKLLNFFVI